MLSTTNKDCFPKISIVTPSLNQGQFLANTIRSVLDQRYPNLEYIVVDARSIDNTLDVISKYASNLAYWISEDDSGQFDAINKGFEKSTGEIMAWINSDDKYLPWALQTVSEIFVAFPEIDWITTATLISLNQQGEVVGAAHSQGYSRNWFYRGLHLGNQPNFKQGIQQESTFWRRSLWEKAGGYVDANLKYAGDFELWARFWKHSNLTVTSCPLAGFRYHPGQKTSSIVDYYREAEQILNKYRTRPRAYYSLEGRLEKFVGRFDFLANRFGSPLSRVEYDFFQNKWVYTCKKVI